MGKQKPDKTTRDKAGSGSIVPEPDDDLTKLSEPYTCTGHFQNDFTELCRRNQMAVIPLVISRPHRPASPTLPSVAEEKNKPGKGSKKDDKNQIAQEAERDSPQMSDQKDPVEPPPKTYTTKEEFEYFRPCVQVEMEYPDKQDSVTEVFIRGWKIDETMMNTLKNCWITLSKLHTINLWSTGLDDLTLEFLASFIHESTSLKTLILDNNPVKSEVWHMLIKEDCSVQHLSLRYNNISDVGAEGIGKALGTLTQQNQKLLSLNLTGNKIGDAGAEHIARGLRMNRWLLFLSLASNQIGDIGGKKISEVISRFPLTHEEVVFRRRLISDSLDRKSSSPVVGAKRSDSHDRPGSVRSQSILPGGTKAKGGKPPKKSDPKSVKEEEKSKGKSKDAERLTAKKGSSIEASKSKKKKVPTATLR